MSWDQIYSQVLGNYIIPFFETYVYNGHRQLDLFLNRVLENDRYNGVKDWFNRATDYLEKKFSIFLWNVFVGMVFMALVFTFYLHALPRPSSASASPDTCDANSVDSARIITEDTVRKLNDLLAERRHVSLTFGEFLKITSKPSSWGWKLLGWFIAIVFTFIRVVWFGLTRYPDFYSFIQPLTDIWNTTQLFFLRFRKFQHENDKSYPDLCIVGWNILIRNPEDLKYRISLPTEETIHIEKVFNEATALQDMVLKIVLDQNRVNPEGVPDFIVVVPEDRHPELHRLIGNCLSNSVRSSLWPGYAHRYKNVNKHMYESALYLITYEADAPVKAIRIWLMFQEELKIFHSLNLVTNEVIDQHFTVPNKNWYLRIKNLQKWAIYAFKREGENLLVRNTERPGLTPEARDRAYERRNGELYDRNNLQVCDKHTGQIFLPLFNENDLLVTVEWNVFHHQPTQNRPITHLLQSTSNCVSPSYSLDSLPNAAVTLSPSVPNSHFQNKFQNIVQKTCALKELIHNYESLRSTLFTEQQRVFSNTSNYSASSSITDDVIERRKLTVPIETERALFSDLVNDFLTEQFNHSTWCEYAYQHRFRLDHPCEEVHYFISFEKCARSQLPKLQILLCFAEDLKRIANFRDIDELVNEYDSRMTPAQKRERFKYLMYWGNHLQYLEHQRVLLPVNG